jgi:transposase-like protein
MTESEIASEILPVDSRGRVRVSVERREAILDEYEKSGLSGAQFARTVGLKYQTFAYWRQLRRRRQPALASAGKPATVEWLETVIDKAQASTPVSASMLIVRLPSGAAIELTHASQASVAATLLRAWEKASC